MKYGFYETDESNLFSSVMKAMQFLTVLLCFPSDGHRPKSAPMFRTKRIGENATDLSGANPVQLNAGQEQHGDPSLKVQRGQAVPFLRRPHARRRDVQSA